MSNVSEQGSVKSPLSRRDFLKLLGAGGTAAKQSPPSNALPKLDLEADENGFLFIKPPVWGVNDNGVVGYGRFVK